MSLEEKFAEAIALNRPTRETKETVTSLMRELQSVVNALESEYVWQIRCFGSHAFGLNTRDSVVDLITYDTDSHEPIYPRFSGEFLTSIITALEQNKDLKVTSSSLEADLPLLKLCYKEHTHAHLTCNNIEPFLGTQLLSDYVSLGSIVNDALFLTKCWAKSIGALDSEKGYLSAYAVAIFMLYFMQVDEKINLPCLPTRYFDRGSPPELSWTLDMPLSEIFKGFLSFYVNDFKWGDEVVSVHLGQRTNRFHPRHERLIGCTESRLHIADPIVIGRNFNEKVTPEIESTLREHFQKALQQMSEETCPAFTWSDTA
eukprot:TRINITY_DN74695_c0_g1_i1.p1 TRINITY_DN74695_c0_g1~~TRINITY_DN74695_c0_g1_i1.p1  ORF type:complete len:337 (-),score=46.40 TRINITY_DN74695_c0_g1_i1:80-1024(-)